MPDYSLASERYDQHSVTTRCTLDSGAVLGLDHASYYQKYGGQSERRSSPLEGLATYFRERLGYADMDEERMGRFIKQLRARYS